MTSEYPALSNIVIIIGKSPHNFLIKSSSPVSTVHIMETKQQLTSFLDKFGSGSGVVKSISPSISEISSAPNPTGICVSPVELWCAEEYLPSLGFDVLLPLASFRILRFCIISLPMIKLKQRNTPAATDIIKYK